MSATLVDAENPTHENIEGYNAPMKTVPVVEPNLPGRRHQASAGVLQTVMVVEDRMFYRNSVRRALEREGYRVLLAQDAEDACAKFEQHGRDVGLVLTDVVLPDGSAMDLASSLRGLRPDLRLVFFSAYTEDALRSVGIDLHGEELVAKPTTAAGIIEVVERAAGA